MGYGNTMATLKKKTKYPTRADRWCHRVEIAGSTGTIYKISFDKSQMCWVCSCRGCIRWGQCKHLTSCGLKGRTHGRQNSIPTKKPNVPKLTSY